MHQVIYTLVEASTQEDALVAGKTVFGRLIGAGPHTDAVFDYYVTFDEVRDGVGKDRWGDLPVAAPVASAEGCELLERGWQATTSEFERHLDRVRDVLDEFSDDEIMRNEDLARHAFHEVGSYEGPSIYLYDQYGNGIRDPDQLDRTLDESDDLWIVPADVHF
ncbi:hypothetical protein [Halomicrococcus gelatinilyticus]|uniref:hypothetical protein n=1 Tax=Halomicrococcus gelatinilyticus TaxID=1702103 RepID=UPI002E158EA4